MDIDKQKAGPGLAGLLKKRCCQIVSGVGGGRREVEHSTYDFLSSIPLSQSFTVPFCSLISCTWTSFLCSACHNLHTVDLVIERCMSILLIALTDW